MQTELYHKMVVLPRVKGIAEALVVQSLLKGIERVLDGFATFLKATISFVMSVSLR